MSGGGAVLEEFGDGCASAGGGGGEGASDGTGGSGSADSTGGTAATVTNNYTLTIAVPTLTLTPAAGALPGGTAGTAYTQTFTASNGIAPYTYALASGALPAGLTLNTATGALSGTPSAPGTFTFTIKVTCADGCMATQTYTISIAPCIYVLNPLNPTFNAGGGTGTGAAPVAARPSAAGAGCRSAAPSSPHSRNDAARTSRCWWRSRRW